MTTLDPAPAGAASAHGARAATKKRASRTLIRAQCSARAILCGSPPTSHGTRRTRSMAQEKKGVVTLKGAPLTLVGPEIKPGQRAPDFTAVDTSLQAVRLSDAKGKVLIVSSVPSLDTPRSEEHTSELQSLAYLVCRLLLEKKKKKNNNLIPHEYTDTQVSTEEQTQH